MNLLAVFNVLLLIVLIFLVVKTIVKNIEIFFFVLVVTFFLALYFGISFSDVSGWVSTHERMQWITNLFVNMLLFSF